MARKSKMVWKLLQVGHPSPQKGTEIAEQIVGLAGHRASPHWTALVFNVSPSTARLYTHVGLKAILRASCSEQEKTIVFELAQNTPMAQTWKTKVDILTHTSPEPRRKLLAPVFLHCRQTQINDVTASHFRVRLCGVRAGDGVWHARE